MSDGTIHYIDDNQIDYDWSQEVPSSINIVWAPSKPQARGIGGNNEAIKNKYIIFFSCMDENSDTDIKLNEVVIPKNKQGTYGSKDNLWYSELSTVLVDPKFGEDLILSVVVMQDWYWKSNQAWLYSRSLC